MSTDRRHLKLQRQKKRRRRILFFLVIPFLLITLSAAGYGTYLYKKAENAVNDSYNDLEGREKSDKRDTEVNPDQDNISILFIGVDESDSRNFGDAVRSDALMLATLNEKNKTVKLVSIPRDSYVYVDEVGYKTKINHAFAYGGAKASMETVEELLDIPVDYYVKMNFYAFIDVVDALNGITVEVPYELFEKDSEDNNNAIHILPGEQELDGEEALAFARTRKLDNDIERGKRQQDILKAIMRKASQANSISKYDNVIEAVGDNMETNMTFSEMKTLGKYGINKDLEVETLTVNGTDTYIDEVYYWELDPSSVNSISTELKDHLEVSSRDDKENKVASKR
ncbi:LytR family transcriptional regulator [Rossellomorea vietnamensis]|uniref:LytR family transcriptional regulator n=1 Tax=Rossellomorea vietnamensis TaxID=218284 RepID=A0A5D4MBC8_9BACI|nr:LCP family protein [Rossellomorea vietnamensis]TYR98936.1 LytR family transcriptional regulator [Rossellomorea vietnamensis]